MYRYAKCFAAKPNGLYIMLAVLHGIARGEVKDLKNCFEYI